MRYVKQVVPALALFLALTGQLAGAGQEVPSAEQIGQWIQQLDADEFSARETATAKLTEAGKAAVEALTKAATSDSLETSTRSMQVLRKLFASDDEPTKTATQKALEKIAEAGHSTSSPRANALIHPKPAPAVQPGLPNIGIIGGNVIAATAKSISVSNVNGVKEISVEEDGRKVKIKDDPQKGIEISVTETQNGKQTTKTVQAKNADELQKIDKDAYRLYKEYDQQGGGGAIQVQIQAGGIPGGIQIQPLLPPQIQGRVQFGPAIPLEPIKRIEAATKQLQLLGKHLQQATKEAAHNEELQKALKDLEAELKKQLADVQKQLAKKSEPDAKTGDGDNADAQPKPAPTDEKPD